MREGSCLIDGPAHSTITEAVSDFAEPTNLCPSLSEQLTCQQAKSMSALDCVNSSLGNFELMEHDAKGDKPNPYDWKAPHWIPNPVPAEYDIVRPPWLRPEQLPMSFVGQSGVLHGQIQRG